MRRRRATKVMVLAVASSLALSACATAQVQTAPPVATGDMTPRTTATSAPATPTVAPSAVPPSAEPAVQPLAALQPLTVANAGGIRLLRTLEIPGFGQAGASQCSVAFSPDGKLLSGACYQLKLPVWDVHSGRLLLSLESSAPLVAVAFSPDGRTLAAGGLSDMIDLYDTATGSLIRTLGPVQSPTWELAFSPTGDRLASAHKGPGSASGAADSTNMNLWDVSTGSLLWGSEGGGAGSLVLSVDYAPDGETVAYGDLEDALIVDARTGKLLRTLPVGDHVGDLAFRPDGTLLATGSDDDKVRLWRTADDGLQAVLEGHSGYVNGVSFSPDGSLLVSGGRDQKVGVWDVGSGQRLAWLDGHENAVLRVAIDPADALIASIAWDGTIRLWGLDR